MDVKLSEMELRSAIKDWLEKQMPELLKNRNALISHVSVNTYPTNATVSVDFVIEPSEEAVAAAK